MKARAHAPRRRSPSREARRGAAALKMVAEAATPTCRHRAVRHHPRVARAGLGRRAGLRARCIEPVLHAALPDAAPRTRSRTRWRWSSASRSSPSCTSSRRAGAQEPRASSARRRSALAVAWPMRAFYVVFYPAIWLLNWMASPRARGCSGSSPAAASARGAQRGGAARCILHSSAQAGSITAARAELLERALSSGEKTARQVHGASQPGAVPGPGGAAGEEHRRGPRGGGPHLAAGVPRQPRPGRGRGEREGPVLPARRSGELHSLAQVQRPVLFVPENVTLEQLLSEFRRRRRQMAVVVDEHGGTSAAGHHRRRGGRGGGRRRGAGPAGRARCGRFPAAGSSCPAPPSCDDLEDRLDVSFDVDDDEHGEVTHHRRLPDGEAGAGAGAGRPHRRGRVRDPGGRDRRPPGVEGPDRAQAPAEPPAPPAASA